MNKNVLEYILRLKDEATKDAEKASKSISSTFKSLSKSVGDVGKAMTLSVTAPAIAAGAAAISFAKIGGQYESIRDSFQSMTKDMGVDVDEFQKRVAAATGGQLDNLTILQGATRGLSLIGKEAFNDFGTDFEKMAELSKKAARATGQDVGFMFDSLVLGISRESKMILDNLGINLDITKAKQDYAKEIGKTTDALTQSEEKHAVLKTAMEQLESTYGDVAVSAGGFSGAWQVLTTALTNARIEIGQALGPALTDLANQIEPIINEFAPMLISLIDRAAEAFINLEPEMKKSILIFGGLAIVLGPVLTLVSAILSPIGLMAVGVAGLVAVGALLINELGGWEEVQKKVNDVVSKLGDIYNEHLRPALDELWSKIKDELIPELKRLWDQISPVLIPALKFLAQVLGVILVAGLKLAIGFLTFVIDKVSTAIRWFNDFVDVIRGIPGKISGALEEAKNLLNKLNPFHRESPSLVDNVLAGVKLIRKEYESLASLSLPSINSQFAPAFAGAGGMGNTTNNSSFQAPITINANISNDLDAYELAQLIGFELEMRSRF